MAARVSGAAMALMAAASASALPAARVSGRVVDAADGHPLAAKVALLREPPFGHTAVDPVVVRETVTTADGLYDLAIPDDDATYRVEAVAPAHARAVAGEGIVAQASATTLPDVKLAPGGAIEGRAVGPDGRGLAGATVKVRSPDRVAPAISALAGPDGAFRIEGVDLEGGTLLIRARGLAPAERPGVRPGASVTVKLARGVSLAGRIVDAATSAPVPGVEVIVEGGSGSETTTDAAGSFAVEDLVPGAIALRTQDDRHRPATWRGRVPITGRPLELRLEPGASLSVRVRGGTGPIAGARVVVRGKDGAALGSAVADARGVARVGGLPSLPLLATASATGYLEAETGDLVLRGGEDRNLSVALPRAPKLSGLVVDAQGSPLSGVHVMAEAIAAASWRPWQLRAKRRLPAAATDRAGRFELAGLPIDGCKVVFQRDGLAACELRLRRLSPGEERAGLRVTLGAAALCSGRVVDASGLARAAVPVSLYDTLDAMELEDPRLAPAAATTSGPDGSFLIPGLPVREMSLVAGGGPWARTAPAKITLLAGRVTSAGNVVVREGSAIAGTVRDADDRPVAGAEIRAGKSFLVTGYRTTCGEGGTFRLDGLPGDATLVVFAEAPGLQRAEAPGVRPGGPPITLRMKPELHLRGRVVERGTNAPVVEFAVAWKMSAADARGESGGVYHVEGKAETFASTEGAFDLAGLPEGRIDLSVRALGYVRAVASRISIPAEGDAPVVVEMDHGVAIGGRVFDDRRAPISGAMVGVGDDLPDGAGIFATYGNTLVSMTDADGAFRLEGIAPGIVEVEALVADHPKAGKRVEALEDLSGVEIVVSRGAAISGEARRRDGAPAAGATVTLRAADPLGGRDDAADAAGHFRFDGLSPGAYVLTASTAAGAVSKPETVLVGAEDPAPIVLQIAPGARIDGRVSGLPPDVLPHVTASASWGAGSRGTAVGGDGRFTVDDVPPGDLRITAATEPSFGGRSVTVEVAVAEGQAVVPVEVVFPRGSRLSGRATRGDEPVAGALLLVVAEGDVEGGTQGSTTTAADGSFRVDGLSDGAYAMTLLSMGAVGRYAASVTVSGDTRRDIEIPTASVEGVVLDAAHKDPVAGASVTLLPQDAPGGTVLSAVTDSAGRFSIAGVPDGACVASAAKSGFASASRVVNVTSGAAEGDVEILLPKEALLVLHLVDARLGVPPASASVAIVEGAAITTVIPVDGDRGAFAVPGLAAGSVSLVVLVGDLAPVALAVTVPGEASVQVPAGGKVDVRLSGGSGTAQLVGSDGTQAWLPGGALGARTVVPVVAPRTTIGPVRAGSYQLVVTVPAGPRAFPVTVVDGEIVTVTVP